MLSELFMSKWRDLLSHPGDTLRDVLKGHKVSQAELARKTGLTERYISELVSGQRDITPEVALKLEDALGVDAGFWIRRQASFDRALRVHRERDGITEEEKYVQATLENFGIGTYVRRCAGIDERGIPDNELIELRKALRVSNLIELASLVPDDLAGLSMDMHALGAMVSLEPSLRSAHVNDIADLVAVLKNSDLSEILSFFPQSDATDADVLPPGM